MSRLSWDDSQSKPYEAGVDRGVFYAANQTGVPWNGLIAVKEAPENDGLIEKYIDGIKFGQRRLPGGFAATVEAYTYPPEIELGEFGFCYRTANEHGYKLHLVYNALAKPSNIAYLSLYDSAQAASLSFDITTRPTQIPGAIFSSHLVVDSQISHPWTLKAVEDALYGTEATEAHLPSPEDVLEIVESNAVLRIIDNGDGTWTAIGPDSAISMLDSSTFQISWPTVVYLDEVTYSMSSL